MQAAREVVLIALPTTAEKDFRRLICRSMAPQAVEPADKAEEGLARESLKQLPVQAFGTGRRDELVPAIRLSVARPHGDSARVYDFNCQKQTCFGQLKS